MVLSQGRDVCPLKKNQVKKGFQELLLLFAGRGLRFEVEEHYSSTQTHLLMLTAVLLCL